MSWSSDSGSLYFMHFLVRPIFFQCFIWTVLSIKSVAPFFCAVGFSLFPFLKFLACCFKNLFIFYYPSSGVLPIFSFIFSLTNFLHFLFLHLFTFLHPVQFRTSQNCFFSMSNITCFAMTFLQWASSAFKMLWNKIIFLLNIWGFVIHEPNLLFINPQ